MLHRTVNGGQTWESLSSRLKGLPAGSWIPQVRISPHNPDEVYVVANNYRRNDWAPYLYRTRDGGAKWERIIDQDDVLGHAQSVLQDPVEPNLLWCGTEQGLWWSFDGGEYWQRWTDGVPAVPVRDIVLQERESDLVLGTFGRGVYVIDGLEVVRAYVSGWRADDSFRWCGLHHVPPRSWVSWPSGAARPESVSLPTGTGPPTTRAAVPGCTATSMRTAWRR